MKSDGYTQLRDLLLSGAASKPTIPADRQYFARLRHRVRQAKSATGLCELVTALAQTGGVREDAG